MATLRQRVQQVIDQNKTMHSNSAYSTAPTSVYSAWQAMTEEQQSWVTLTLTANELEALNCIQRIQGRKSAADLIYLIKNRLAIEQLAQKLGIENKGEFI